MNKETGGPAFPRPASEAHTHGMHSHQEGMTLRDWFAGKAMQGLIGGRWRPDMHGKRVEAYTADAEQWAQASYRFADAMLEARKQ